MNCNIDLEMMKSGSSSFLSRPCASPPTTLCASSSLQLRSHLGRRFCRVSLRSGSLVSPIGLVRRSPFISRRMLLHRSAVAFAAPREDSEQGDLSVEVGYDNNGPVGDDSQEEAWKQALANFREQASKMQVLSQEAYKVNSAKAMTILKESSERMRIQTEAARRELIAMAKDIGEEGGAYISRAAENTPEPVKEVVETFSTSVDDLHDISKFRDYHVGIPYGLLLCVGGFLSFMLTDSTAAIRFGVILGGILLALSVSSIRLQKKGEKYLLPVKGQAAIVAIIFVREITLLSQRPWLIAFANSIISGVMLAFYIYRIAVDHKKTQGLDLEQS